MIGTTDNRLLIDRVGRDSEALLGYQPAELLGRSILSFVDSAQVPDMFGVFVIALQSQGGVSAAVAIRSKNGQVLQCDALVVPLVPAPSTAFALVPEEVGIASAAARHLMQGVWDGTGPIDLSSDLATAHAEAELPGVTALTTREREIVRGLLSGDRVGAIADRLFLSQSTIRSHLSSVYSKLGVHSQQQVVNRFRLTDGHPRPLVADGVGRGARTSPGAPATCGIQVQLRGGLQPAGAPATDRDLQLGKVDVGLDGEPETRLPSSLAENPVVSETQ